MPGGLPHRSSLPGPAVPIGNFLKKPIDTANAPAYLGRTAAVADTVAEAVTTELDATSLDRQVKGGSITGSVVCYLTL